MVAFYGRWGSFDWFFSLATFDLFSTLLKFDIHFNKWKNFVSLVLNTSVPKRWSLLPFMDDGDLCIGPENFFLFATHSTEHYI